MINMEIKREGDTIVVSWTDPSGGVSQDVYTPGQPQYEVYDALLDQES